MTPADRAQLEQAFADDVRAVYPTASVGLWQNEPADPTWRGGAWFSRLYTADGGDLDVDSSDPAFDAIVARYEDALGWTSREEGVGQVFSFDERRDISDPEGRGLEQGHRHPALEWMWW